MTDVTHTPTARIAVVLITDTLATIRRVMQHLARQTRAAEMEVVIAHPANEPLDAAIRESRDGFEAIGYIRTVPVQRVIPMAEARAAAVRETTAPLIFLGESHSFAHPTFAEELLNAFDGSCDVLVPGFGNANPDRALSWAAFMFDYGAWLYARPAGFIASGPTWNSAYSRETLQDVYDVLDVALSHGTLLAERLRAGNRRVRFVPSARIDHANVATGVDWLHERYLSGLLVAVQRRTDWSIGRRLLYVALSPLIPVVTLARVRRTLALAWRRGMLPSGTIPPLIAGAIVRTVGEVVGYLTNPGPQPEVVMEDQYELHKLRHVGGPLP